VDNVVYLYSACVAGATIFVDRLAYIAAAKLRASS